ncbi:MAG: hypothetical protein AAGA46_07760 [Cyanobacteria bacterium P01_F01_bin.13]
MKKLDNKPVIGAHQPGPISWKSVPKFIQTALIAQGCILLQHHRQHPQRKHIRFQYVPLFYKGHLYYLQRWSHDEWGVSPSQLLFPDGSPCLFELLNHGSLLSLIVKKAVAKFYGLFPDDFPSQPSSVAGRDTDKMLPLAC